MENLQKDLVIAVKNSNYEKIKNIQEIITNTLEIRALAVHKITDKFNTSPGIDNIFWASDFEKMEGAMSLDSNNYESQPFRKIIIRDKYKLKERNIAIPTFKDRAMQMLYSFALDPIAEATGDKKSFAFRRGRSALDAHSYICEALKYPDSPQWVFLGDIKSCYESISHQWLLKNIPMNKHVLLEFLKAGFVFGNELFPTEQGIMLGMSISPIIANMALDGLQKIIFKNHNLNNYNSKIDYGDGNLIRYADDIIVTARTEESAYKIKDIVEKFLSVRGLKLSEKKTKILHVSQGFDYLSRNYCKHNGVLCVTPSEKSVNYFKQNLRDFILINGKKKSQRLLIKGINARLQGWAGYHRVEESQDAFRHIDNIVSVLLLKLMQELYPKRTKKQILDKFWYEDYNNYKYFSLPYRRDIRVIHMKDIILVNHNLLVLNKNPYTDFDYFESRTEYQDIQKVNGKYKSVWERQNGKCYYCGHKIDKYQNKKIVSKYLDNNNICNLVYIHERCAQDEIIFTHTNIENPDNIDFFEIAQEITDTYKKQSQNSVSCTCSSYENLKNYFLNHDENKIILNFNDIEKILCARLPENAYKYECFWYKNSIFTETWQSQGFEISKINLKKQKIYFKKIKKIVSKLCIPKVFFTDKIPNNAKYELERFFKYIQDKYKF